MDARLKELTDKLRDETWVKARYQDVKKKFPPFPADASAATLSVFLDAVGIDVTFEVLPGSLVAQIEARGWKLVAGTEDARAGDVFVTVTTASSPGPDHIGFVAAPGPHQHFMAADNHMGAPFFAPYVRKQAGDGQKLAVDYFLRAPG